MGVCRIIRSRPRSLTHGACADRVKDLRRILLLLNHSIIQMLIIYNVMVCYTTSITARLFYLLFDVCCCSFFPFFPHEVRSCRVGSGARWRSGCSADARCARWWYVTTDASSTRRQRRRRTCRRRRCPTTSTTIGQPSASRLSRRPEFAFASPAAGLAELSSTTALPR